MNKNYELLNLILCISRKAIYFGASIEALPAKQRHRLLGPANPWKTRDTNPTSKNSTYRMMLCISPRWWVLTQSWRSKMKSTSQIDSSLSERPLVIELNNSEKIHPMRSRRNRIEEKRLASLKLHWVTCIRCYSWRSLIISC